MRRPLLLAALVAFAATPLEAQEAQLAPAATYGYFEPAAIAEAARQALLAGDYAGAHRLIAPIANTSTYASASTQVIAGLSDAGLGDLAGARWHFQMALQMNRRNLGARAGLALTLARLGDTDAAAGQLRWLEAHQQRCAGRCSDAVTIDQAVAAARRAIGTPAG